MTSVRRWFGWIVALIAMSVVSVALSVAGPQEVPSSTAPGARSLDPRRDMITELPASRPHPSLGDEAHAFDRLVGTWDCEYSFHAEDGTVTRASGELRFGWIIDGHALQDIWITYPKEPAEERLIGTSLRFFDAKTKVWRVVFVLPALGLLTTVEGRAEGDRIVLAGDAGDGARRRWSFNDIRADSFVWRGEKSRDDGKTWRLVEEHQMRRRSAR
jgi:hypothetical protein